LDQLQAGEKNGGLEQLLSLIPVFNAKAIKDLKIDGKELVKIEAIINSMTKEERSTIILLMQAGDVVLPWGAEPR